MEIQLILEVEASHEELESKMDGAFKKVSKKGWGVTWIS